jgi:glycerol-3-phosphate acyltransferase PlsX
MGRAYAEVALGVTDPRIALLSNGEEPSKGNELVKAAHALLASLPVRFAGNIDAAQWLDGTADVVVTDGFTGNVALKVGESVVAMAMALAGANAGVPAEAWSRFDHAKAGGAPLIGVNGLLVVGHGRADAAAIANGIALTARLAAEGLTARVAEAVGRVLK